MPRLYNLFFRWIMVIYGLCIPPAAHAQYFTLGTDPQSVKWKSIKTNNFKLVYPDEYEVHSIHIANGLEYIYLPGSRTLGNPKPARTPFIVHTRSTRARAYSPYAPHRIEFITTPPQDFYTQNWIDDIIIHEYRHVAQYACMRKGFTRGLSYVIGEQAIPVVVGLFVPMWFLEGDATILETTMSHSGRGRVANFEMRLKAQFLEKGIYSYEKAVLGSYRDFTPSYYELGYQIVGASRVRYGPQFCEKTLDQVGRKAYTLVPFSNSLKKQTGLDKYRLYESIASELQEKWMEEEERTVLTSSEIITEIPGNDYICYGKPHFLNQSYVVAEKISLDDIPRIVIIDPSGKEKQLTVPGKGFVRNSLSVNGHLVCWQENEPDPRWSLQDFMVIKTYNTRTKKTTHLTQKTRYFSPAISPDGSKIVVIRVDGDNFYHLAVINAQDGEETGLFNTDENLFLSHPSWDSDNITVAAVATGKAGKGIVTFNTDTGGYQVMTPFGYAEVDWPVFYKNYILFVGSYSGIDNIYALDRKTKSISQVTSVRFGAGSISVSKDHDLLYYLNYSSTGFRIERFRLDTALWKPREDPELNYKWYSLAEVLASQEDFLYQSDSVSTRIFSHHQYHKWQNLFNFHSWAPLGVNIENKSMSPGIMLMSQNLLGNSFTSIGWSYDLNEQEHQFNLSYSYDGLYPALTLLSDFGYRKGIQTTPDSADAQTHWKEFNLTGRIGFPFTWNAGAWSIDVQPILGLNFKKVMEIQGFDNPPGDYNLLVSEYELFFANRYEMSLRDFLPRWAQTIEVAFRHTPIAGQANAVFGINAIVYLPGIALHHSLKLFGGYQKKWVDCYAFHDIITYPRGYNEIFLNEAISLSGEYAFPISYPDWRIGPMLYIKRFKAALFCDLANGLTRQENRTFWSAGADFTTDFHLLGIVLPLEAGIRTVYLSESKMVKPYFLIAVKLDSLY